MHCQYQIMSFVFVSRNLYVRICMPPNDRGHIVFRPVRLSVGVNCNLHCKFQTVRDRYYFPR